MAAILMILSKISYFSFSENKGILKKELWRQNFCLWRHLQTFITWLKLCYRCGHVTKVWQHFYERSYYNLNFVRIWREQPFFEREVLLVQVQQFGTGTRCGLEILHQCGKKVKTTNVKVLGANSYVCRSYRGKIVWEHLFAFPILNRVNGFFSFKFHDRGARLDDLK